MTFRPARRDTVVALGGLLAGAALATAVAAAAWPAAAGSGPAKAASGSAKAASASPTGPTLAPDPVNETLRPKEIVLPSQSPYTSGKIVVEPLRMTCGLSDDRRHARRAAGGRPVLPDPDRADRRRHLHAHLRRPQDGADDHRRGLDPGRYDAQEVKRQPLEIAPVGSHDRYEFDIYYDVPRDATVNGFTFSDGEGGPTVRVPLPVRVWPFS